MLNLLINVLVFFGGFFFAAWVIYSTYEEQSIELSQRSYELGAAHAMRRMGYSLFCQKNGDYGDAAAPQPLPVTTIKCRGCPNKAGCPVVLGAADKDVV